MYYLQGQEIKVFSYRAAESGSLQDRLFSDLLRVSQKPLLLAFLQELDGNVQLDHP